MLRYSLMTLLAGAVVLAGCQTDGLGTSRSATVAVPAYPATTTVAQEDTYHGTVVADPYRWLEDDVRESAAVRNWVRAQQAVTGDYLKQLDDTQQFSQRLQTLWNYERRGVPVAAGDRYFYSYNDGLMNQNQVFVTEDLSKPGRLLLDPNSWAKDGTTALASYFPSPDGRYLAYLVQEDGSDWRRARVLDVETGALRSDDLQWLKFTNLHWAGDSSGFYYSRFPAPEAEAKFQALNTDHTVYRHQLGMAQQRDTLVFHDPANTDWNYGAAVSDDGAYLVIRVTSGTADGNQVLVQNLSRDIAPRYLVRGFDHAYSFLGHRDGQLLFETDLEAPLGRVVAFDAKSGELQEVVPEQDAALQSAVAADDHLLLSYLTDAHTQLRRVSLAAAPAVLEPVALPALGTAGGFSGKLGDKRAFYSFSSFAIPSQVLQLNLRSGESTAVSRSDPGIDPAAYTVTQRFVASADGTRVPMFIVHRAGLKLDGSHPTILYGYGGFGVSLTPGYSTARMAWLQAGGVYAVANLRGGGEYGKTWHKAGTKLRKQNVFDDMIAAAEDLIAAGYTAPSHLSVLGGSNGGLLVGAVINQRPDLFAAAVPMVGVMDMLRFQRFTAGRYWVDDYGSSDDAAQFKALYAYSPYHNIVADQSYPATLIYTADTDDRVVPGHSFKYAARLQAQAARGEPALLYVESNAGHGAGTPTEKLIRRYGDFWRFLWHHLSQDA